MSERKVDLSNVDVVTMAEFDHMYTAESIRTMRVFVPVGLILILVFIPWDWMMIGAIDLKPTYIRLCLAVILVLLWLATSHPIFARTHKWLTCLAVSICGIGISFVLSHVPDGFVYGVGGIAIVLMYTAGAVRLPGIQTAVACALIVVSMVGFMFLRDSSVVLLISNLMLTLSLTGLAVLYNIWSRRDALTIFLYERRLRTEMDRSTVFQKAVTEMRDQRFHWLENVVRFLRHELKNQMTAVATSVDMAQRLTVGSDPSLSGLHRLNEDAPRYLMRAQASLTHMRKLVDSATEATSLEAALASEEFSRVDLAELVAERMLVFAESHAGVEINIGAEPGLFVRGNEGRLIQLLEKLLSNSLEHLREGGVVSVRVLRSRTDERRVQLVVENEGDYLLDDTDAIFDPFVTTASKEDNLGIGLYVVRVIATGHAGTVRAYNLEHKPGAGFEVTFPAIG